MAKARGNKLVPPANYSRNPMQGWADQERAVTGGILSLRPGQAGQNWRQAQRDWAALEQGATLGWGEQPNTNAPMQLLGGAPRSFNPANQGLDFSGLLALYGENRPSQQTGRNPRLTTPNTPLVSNSMMPYRGPSAVDMAGDRASAAQIRNSANQINSLIARSQAANPMVPRSPGFGVVDPATESTRRLAPMLAQDAARQQNTPMNGMTAYEANPMRYRPGDPAIQARQLDNAQRATMGQPMDRTRDSGALNAYISSGGTPWYERERQARDQMAMQARQSTPEFQAAMAAMQQQKTAREALRDRSNLNVPQAELDRRNDADTARREREARHNRFKDASGGMNYKQYDRLQRQNALTMKAVDEGRLSPEAANFRMQTRADKALRRAGNPMAMGDANRGRLFPDMLAGRGGRAATPAQNPMGSPIAAGAPNTAENIQARNSLRAGITQGVPATATTPAIPPSPFIQSLGVTADASPADVETGLNDMMLRAEVPSPAGLRDLRILVGTYTGVDGESPFASTEVPDSWDSLRNLPENASDDQLISWWMTHQEKVKALRQRQMEQGRLGGLGRIGA